MQVFGGECSKSTQGSGLYCPQKDHSKHGNQFPERIFNLDCGICLETGRPNRMRLDCGMFSISNLRAAVQLFRSCLLPKVPSRSKENELLYLPALQKPDS